MAGKSYSLKTLRPWIESEDGAGKQAPWMGISPGRHASDEFIVENFNFEDPEVQQDIDSVGRYPAKGFGKPGLTELRVTFKDSALEEQYKQWKKDFRQRKKKRKQQAGNWADDLAAATGFEWASMSPKSTNWAPDGVAILYMKNNNRPVNMQVGLDPKGNGPAYIAVQNGSGLASKSYNTSQFKTNKAAIAKVKQIIDVLTS